MKYIYNILLFFLLAQNVCFTQNYGLFQIKEQYDKVSEGMATVQYKPCDIGSSPQDIQDVYGDGMSYILESYIHMYETTGDKAYLIKFILSSLCMQEHRLDELLSDYSYEPRWACKDCNDENNRPVDGMYHDGLIIWAMSHFVYLIKVQEPELNLLSLPQIHNTKIVSNNFGDNMWNTYGDFAEWLRIRTEETLDYYTYGNSNNNYKNYWADDQRCYTPEQDPKNKTRAQAINMQAGFASALFYLGATDPNSDYLHKSAMIAKAYKGFYTEKHPGVLGCLIPTNHVYPVLNLLSNNSYIWKTNGWREITCKEYEDGNNDYEDISHGIQTLIFPQVINNQLESEGTMLFNDIDMIRFRNTFSFNVYAGNSSGCSDFHSGVDGDDVINYNSNFDGLNTLKIRSLAWMSFFKYDGYSITPNVYDIVMNYYSCDLEANNDAFKTGIDLYGLSEVVAAQWEKECVNLTLYNRDVVYNQNFEVKNVLTIGPMGGTTTASFAEPIINTQTFTVEPGVTANFVAGEEIVWKAGTHIKAGSNVHAYIQPSTCINGIMPSSNPPKQLYQDKILSNVQSVETLENEIINTKKDLVNSFTIYPNPGKGKVNIEIDDESIQSFEYKVINVLGTTIQSGMVRGNITSLSLEKGVYIVHVGIDNSWYIQRLVIE